MDQETPTVTAQSKKPKRIEHADLLRAALDEIEAAAYINLSISSLRKGRMNGKRHNYVEPPPYLKLGRRIVYLKADLDAWLLSHRVEV